MSDDLTTAIAKAGSRIGHVQKEVDETVRQAARTLVEGGRAALGTPEETAEADYIELDEDGGLDDVVISDCMAHLERLDDGRWFLGLYGDDGRTLTIEIASKTGRAAVLGSITYHDNLPPSIWPTEETGDPK